ncbi:MAG: hypothetical protein LBP41_03085 [Holosporaceae bacterium]|jgi:hypothetical protein|nr:hypothetical protein [Holosporaceae bacterium]
MKKIVFAATAFLSYAATLAAEDVAVTAVDEGSPSCQCAFDSVYLGLGVGGSFLKAKAEAKAEAEGISGSKNVNRFIGSVLIGGGKTFKKFYVGAEGLLDFSKSKDNYFEKDVSGVKVSGNLKSDGVSAQLGIRLGAVIKDSWLVFFKVAGVHDKVTLKTGEREGSCSKIAPALSLGVEKLFCKKFSARLEGQYVFKADKTAKFLVADREVDVKVKNDGGFVIRALVAYNVKY